MIAVVWFLQDDLEHIEDTNGPDDYSLTTITDQQIIDKSVGALNVKQKKSLIGDTIEFSSDKFTGVYEILYDNYIGSSDFEINLYSFTVNEGNFKMVVIHDDEIVATLEPDLMLDYRLENVKGKVSLVIAGESADFAFSMTESEYNDFAHN